ncbi:hypothetical protein [Nostoc sp. FACHB-190]|nr:hypothetical protein [Nostoc sp. FACHB-190]
MGEGSPDETSVIAKHESGTSIFTQHSALSTFKSGGKITPILIFL